MTPTCGLDGCVSGCHNPEALTGRYCAPARCYCGGCPGHVPVERGQAVTPAQAEARRRQALADLRDQLAHDREAGDLAAALSGEPLARPSIAGGRFLTASRAAA